MSRCQNNILINSCEECVALQDPSCVWHLPKQKCISRDNLENFHKEENDKQDIYVQDVKKGSNKECPIQKKENPISRNATADNKEVNELSTKALKLGDIEESSPIAENITQSEIKSKSNDSYQSNDGSISSKHENQELNVLCVSCECPCNLSDDLPEQAASKSEPNKQIVSGIHNNSRDDTNLSFSSQSETQDKKVTNTKIQAEDNKTNAEKESDNLIQSGIVVDISSIKEQGLEHADKVCKYILCGILIFSFS